MSSVLCAAGSRAEEPVARDIGESALAAVIASVRGNIDRIGHRIPVIGSVENGWEFGEVSNWVSGFWAGQLWLCYQWTQDAVFRDAAQWQSQHIRELLRRPELHDHDLGFQFSLSSVAQYRLTGSERARVAAMRAAESLLGRFRTVGGYIRAWNDSHPLGVATRGKVIVDSLGNLPLLFWAGVESGDERFADAALEHADLLAKYIVREDYSTFHSFDFDTVTGAPIGGSTYQGYADDSCWSRGQAWSVHGYAQVYRYSGNVAHLELAKSLARYTAERLSRDDLPLWDFDIPKTDPQYRDSSAAAIMAAGMLQMAELCADPVESEEFGQSARQLLCGLRRTCDLTATIDSIGLLRGGASFVNRGLYDCILPYGDYFYVEAWMRRLGRTSFFW